MGFVCKILTCANYVSCCGLANFNSAIIALRFSSLHVSQFLACYPMYCSNASKAWTFLLCCLTQQAKGSWWLRTLQRHCSSFSNVTRPNIHVDMVSSDHRVYSNNDSGSTSDSTSYARDHII